MGVSAGGMGQRAVAPIPWGCGAELGGEHKLAHSEGRGDLRLEIISSRTGPQSDQRGMVSPRDRHRAGRKGQGSGQNAVCINWLWS